MPSALPRLMLITCCGPGLADLADAAVDGDHASLDLRARRVRRVVHRLRAARRRPACRRRRSPDHGVSERHRRGLARAGELRRAEVHRLVGERLVGVGIDQRRCPCDRRTRSRPWTRRCRAHRPRCPSRAAPDRPAVATMVGRLVQPVGLDHQRTRQERLDRRRRDARNLLLARATRRARAAELDRAGGSSAGDVGAVWAVPPCAGPVCAGRPRRRCRAGHAVGAADRELPALAVEHDHVPGIDQVRVADLLPVHVPQLGPAPRRIGVALRDAPKGVAGHDGVAVGRIGLDGRAARWAPAPKAAPESKKASAMIDLRTCWTMATRPFFGSWTGWKSVFLPQCSTKAGLLIRCLRFST